MLAQQAQIEARAVRVAELEARFKVSAKSPSNSSTPSSAREKANRPDRPKKPRRNHPVRRALAETPDRVIEATLAAYQYCEEALR
jgi:hypothetical protein